MTGNKYFDSIKALKWCASAGIGYLPLTDTPYDEAYFEKYVVMAETEMGKKLTEKRLELVRKHAGTLPLVDVGIGSGQFMKAANCMGYDINPTAVKMLMREHAFVNPYMTYMDCATFWDSLEHISDIEDLLKHVTKYIFVSLPIFRDVDHVLSSRHFRPDEHCWYFTNQGFRNFIAAHGFTVLEYDTFETELGREDIGTFVCKRVS